MAFLLGCSIASGTACAANAAELFVSGSGNDANDGTSLATALATIQAAVKKAGPGTTISVAPGWYEGEIKLKPGTKERPMVLRALKPGRVFVGTADRLVGWRRADGLNYTYAVGRDAAPSTLTEGDTATVLRQMAAVWDVEELAGSFAYDPTARLLYVHPTDGGRVERHA